MYPEHPPHFATPLSFCNVGIRHTTGFRRSFEEAERRRIVFVNPRRNFGKADTLEKALDEQQYRIKDIVSLTPQLEASFDACHESR